MQIFKNIHKYNVFHKAKIIIGKKKKKCCPKSEISDQGQLQWFMVLLCTLADLQMYVYIILFTVKWPINLFFSNICCIVLPITNNQTPQQACDKPCGDIYIKPTYVTYYHKMSIK